jgi:hypothetical protein
MITENITKQQFIVQVLERDIKRIFAAELAIAQENIYVSGKELKVTKQRGYKIGVRSGALLESLQNPDYVIQAQGEKFIVSAGIVKHMRFIDMKKYGNRRIYNRQVWGILYNNALKDIRFNYGNAIADSVFDDIVEAFGKPGTKHISFGTAYEEAKKR